MSGFNPFPYGHNSSYVSLDLNDYDCDLLTPNAKATYEQWQNGSSDTLLIDGYMRQICNIQLSSFPNEIQQVIASYYNKKYSKSELKLLIERKKLKQAQEAIDRTQLQQAQEAHARAYKKDDRDFFRSHYVAPCFIGSLYIAILAIATMSTIYAVEDNDCKNGHYSMMDPPYFLLVAGVVLSCNVVLNALITFLFIESTHCGPICRCDNEPKAYCYVGCTCLMLIFYLVWTVIGFVIYVDEASVECKESHIGRMLLSWNIIMAASVSFAVCSPICFIIWVIYGLSHDC